MRREGPKLLRAALLFFAVSHSAGLATMALLLRPGMDPLAFSLAERAAYVAAHASSWWLGWLPWRLAALSNLWVGVAFWRWAKQHANAHAQRATLIALLWFWLAAVPEQWAEWQLVTTFVAGARGELAAWSRDWALYAAVTGVWANFGYTISVGYWMRSATALLSRSVLPPWLERALLAAFVVSGVLTLGAVLAGPASVGVWFAASGAVNGVAFPLLIAWSLLLFRRLAGGELPLPASEQG